MPVEVSKWERVKDFNFRIQNYSEAQKKFYNYMVPKFQEVRDVKAETEGWTVLETKEPSVKLETKYDPIRKLPMVRAWA